MFVVILWESGWQDIDRVVGPFKTSAEAHKFAREHDRADVRTVAMV